MTTPPREPRSGPGPWIGAASLAGQILLLLFVYYGLGAGPPDGGPAWAPTGFLRKSLADGAFAPIVLSVGPALLVFGGLQAILLAVTIGASRSVAVHTIGVTCFVATLSFVLYGIGAAFVWRLFGWRFAACMVAIAAFLGVASTAPLWAERARISPRVGAAGAIAFAFLVIAVERNVTGTNLALPLAVSPWPMVPIVGFDLLGVGIGSLLLGVGLGLTSLARGGRAFLALGALAAAAVPALAMVWASRESLLPVPSGPFLLSAVALASVGIFALGARRAGAGHAPRYLLGAALVLVPITLGQAWARLDYRSTRESRAAAVIEALDVFFAREGTYPDLLGELVDSGDLGGPVRPAIGFDWLSDQEFGYQSFGNSYLLEFSSPRWTQCAYNPPYLDEDEEELAAEDLAVTVGSWSCPSEPPQLY